MNKHKLTLTGGHGPQLRVSAPLLHEVLGALLEGARHAARFAVEGESVRHGPRPAWLDAVCAFDVTGLTPGSTVIALEAPTLREADFGRFGVDQSSLFEQHTSRKLADQSAVDLFGGVLADVVEGSADDVLADRALLESCLRFARVAVGAHTGVRLEGISGRSEALIIKSEHVARIEMLRDETPSPTAARVAGKLDTISASRSDIVLTLPDGTKIPGRLEDHDFDLLQRLFGTEVVVSGVAQFRPSGRLLVIDVESLQPARETDRIFATTPRARAPLSVATWVAQDSSSGVSALFGTWPGDEIDVGPATLVVNITVAGTLHSYTQVPLVSPNVGGVQMFVNHPQVTSFLRRELAAAV